MRIASHLGIGVFCAFLATFSPTPCAEAGEVLEDLLLTVHSYEELRDYQAAEAALVAAIDAANTSGEGATENLVDAHIRLAMLRVRLCRFDAAQETFEQSLLIATTQRSPSPAVVARIWNGLGRVEFCQGNYGRAERLFRRALAKVETELGTEHPVVAQSLRGLADVCRAGRRWNEGEDLARRAVAILESAPDADPEELVLAYASLGFNLRGRGSYNSAELQFRSALDLATNSFGASHPARVFILNHLAGLANNLYQTDRALAHAQEALELGIRLFGTSHVDVGVSYFNLARAHMLAQRTDTALILYAKSLESLRSVIRPDHPTLADVHGFIGFCYAYRRQYDSAMAHAREGTTIRLVNFAENCGQLNEESAMMFASATRYSMSGYPAAYFDAPTVTEEQTRILTDLILASKGMVNEDAFVRRGHRNLSSDERAIELNDELAHIRARKSSIILRDPLLNDRRSSTVHDSLGHAEAGILQEMIELGYLTAESGVAPFVRLADVCARIPENACLVEYYSFHYTYPLSYNKEESRGGALILDRKGIRGHTLLGRLDNCVAAYDSYIASLHQRGQSVDWTPVARAQYDSAAAVLTQTMWQPVEPLIKPGELVLVAPESQFAEISFAGLPFGEDSLLAERNAFHYIGSARDLLRVWPAGIEGNGLLALYDPDFDATGAERMSAVSEDAQWASSAEPVEYAVRSARPLCSQFDLLDLPRLHNTRVEVDRIAAHWQSTEPDPVLRYSGAAASEEVVRRMSSGRRVIHIATHGYFMDAQCRTRNKLYSYFTGDPMLYSGLFLAGANVKGEDADPAVSDDGILTADEVGSLNLTGTSLVVLSACETGRGDNAENHGVFGLSRAFNMAGARQVVSALWPVSDAASIEVMEKIYSAPGRPVAEVLREYAVEGAKADRAAGRSPDPFLLTPYVSYGDWRVH